MAFDLVFIVKVLFAVVFFIIIVRFIFSSSDEEVKEKVSRSKLKEEINDLKRDLKRQDGSGMKGKAEMMDSLMEEYYADDEKRA